MEPEKQQELIAALEDAYNRGVTLEQIQGSVNEDVMSFAQDYYSKKKDGTVGSQAADPMGSILGSGGVGTEFPSTQLATESQAVVGGLIPTIDAARDRGVSLEQIRGAVNPEIYNLAEQYYKSLEGKGYSTLSNLSSLKDGNLIIDDNPSELGRLWNRANASGRLADYIAYGELSGDFNYEDLAYYNYIIQRDAVKEDDALYSDSGVGGFILDVVRAIPESMISAFSAYESGSVGAGAGLAAGSVVPGIGNLTGTTVGFFSSTSLAVEYAASLMQSLQEQGIDVRDMDQLRFAMENPAIMS